MTTSDTTDVARAQDSMEIALRELFAFAPQEHVWARVDERVSLASESIGAGSSSVLRRRFARRRTVIGLLAAAVVLVGAGGLGLYAEMGAGLQTAWDLQLGRSVAVGATDVRDGYRVTIDRAYLDGERLMLAIRVTDELQRPEVGQLEAMYAVVTDANGEWQGIGSATSRPIGQWSSLNVVGRFVPSAAPAASSRQIHVVVPHIYVLDATATPPAEDDQEWTPYHEVEGPWTFDLDLAVDGVAAVATPGTVRTIDGVPVTLREAVVGPSVIRLQVGVDDPTGATWTLLGHVRRGDREFPIVLESLGADGIVTLQADYGTGDASGDWSLVITAADRSGPGEGIEERIAGPWTFEFQIP